MPHFKCATCRTRISTVGGAGDVCEACGSRLELVTDLTELVGYRAVTPSATPGTLAAAIAVALRRPEPPR
jgi:hypothetical protein